MQTAPITSHTALIGSPLAVAIRPMAPAPTAATKNHSNFFSRFMSLFQHWARELKKPRNGRRPFYRELSFLQRSTVHIGNDSEPQTELQTESQTELKTRNIQRGL